MAFRSTVLLTGISALLVLGPITHAFAQNDSARFAPWMALDSSLKDKRPDPLKTQLKSAKNRTFAAAKNTPDVPVITPQDTVDLINQIYGGEDLPEKSVTEQSYSRRIVDDLPQFGYDMFVTQNDEKGEKTNKDADKNTDPALPSGAVQDSFILSIGDKLDITFRGQREDRKTYTIDSEGRLIIDNMTPINAAGLSIGQLRDQIESEASKSYNTSVFIALESVKQANILIIGHVEKPGRRTMTVFNTVIDALTSAGGVEKTGSLRQIKLIRDGRSTIIDLYSLLVHGSDIADIALRDGDRIIVPPLGPTVAISGNVRRAGIYEILPVLEGDMNTPVDEAQTLSLQDMLNLSGGVASPGENRFIRMGLTRDGRETVTNASQKKNITFTNGDILMVSPSREERTGTVELIGETRRPGIHVLNDTPSLASLLNDDKVFGSDIYPLIGVIERRDRAEMAPQMIAFPPLQVLRGQFDRRLQDGDTVRLFSRAQIMKLQQDDETIASNDNDEAKLIPASYGSSASAPEEDPLDSPAMTAFLHERSAFIRGAVRNEGAWPVADGATLENLIAASGGLTFEASTGNIEVTSRLRGEGGQANGRSGIQRISVDLKETDPATVSIGAGDSIRVRQKFQRVADKSVVIIGEVANPGRYDLMPGDKMSDLLTRAGGLTDEAYPKGAIFSRDSERRAEEARFHGQAQELEARLASALNNTNDKKEDIDAAKIGAVRDLVAELRNAEGVGRITVEADPAALSVNPELDMLLESGDRVFVPKRPLTVRVSGEILSPANLQFRKERSARDYIMQAGGYSFSADKDRVFVLYPDGSAQPMAVSSWNYSPLMVPPGSTIVVPRDPKPFDFIETARDVSQILSNLAITGIFLSDIKDDD